MHRFILKAKNDVQKLTRMHIREVYHQRTVIDERHRNISLIIQWPRSLQSDRLDPFRRLCIKYIQMGL